MGHTCGAGAVSFGRVAKIAQIGSCSLAAPPADEQDGLCLATASKQAPSGPDWIHEVKHDS